MEPNKKQPKVGMAQLLPAKIVGPMFLRVALVVVFVTGGLVYLGMLMDTAFNTKPVFTVLLAAASSLLLVFIVYRVGVEADEKSQSVHEDWMAKNLPQTAQRTDTSSVTKSEQ
ncbi:MAG: AtpZ/AtpI family protein [Anaerolineae bacterium]|nr:AtpZ/AtpI family protein [Anaerolineae bacterium]